MSHSLFRFGRFELRPATRELRADGRALRLGERAFDVLLALAEAGGAVVSRETLFERAWPGRVVLDDNLKVQVLALRRTLGAETIVTVPRRGYRLGWPVQTEAVDAAGTTSATPEAPAALDDAPAAEPALFGRDHDLERVGARLALGALVTLVGPGGIGKTRLAQAVAAATAARWPDGHGLVELAPLTDPGTLPATVARSLALPPPAGGEALVTALRPLSLLLVLDNAEHLRDAVATLAQQLLERAPRVALLVTSQEPLGLPHEQVLRLEGLALPADAGDDDPQAVRASAAAALFEARARAAAAGAGFAIDAGNAAAVAALCRRLDGIPLALELAAARVPLLGAAGVLERLGEALALLTRGTGAAATVPPRHQTLRAALRWSHALLAPPQQRLFRRLGVFAGSFTLEAAQRVAGDDELDAWAVLDELQALVAKSLVQVLPDGDRRRFRLLETARQFALERLHDAGEAGALRRRHAEQVLAQFEQAEERAAATPTLEWLEPLRPEVDNLRAATQWALGPDGDEGLAIALAAAGGSFWPLMGLGAESGPVLKRLAPRVDAQAPPATRARFWLAVANRGGDSAFGWRETYEAAERAVEIARAAGLASLLHRALGQRLPLAQRVAAAVDGEATAAEMRAVEGEDWNLLQRRPRRAAEAYACFQRGDWQRFGELERRELALLREAGDLYRAWFVAHRVALADTAEGRAADAVAVMQQAVDEIRARGFLRPCWQQVAMLAMAWIETGRAPDAPVHEAVRLMHGAGAMSWMACHLAEWLAQRARWADAARVLGWLDRWLAERGETASGHGERARERTLAALRGGADAAQIERWQAEGAAWTADDVAAALLAVREGDVDGDGVATVLSRR